MTLNAVTLDGENITCEVAEPLRIARGRRHPAESFAPAVASLTVVTSRSVPRGALLEVAVNAPDTDPRWETVTGTWAGASGTWEQARVRLTVFRGRVTDTRTDWIAVEGGFTLAQAATVVVAADPLAQVLGVDTGGTAWPAETAAARFARLAAAVAPVPVVYPNDATPLAARDASVTDVLTALDSTARSVSVSGGVWWDQVTGTVHVLTDDDRASLTSDVILTSCDVLEVTELTESVTDLVNVATVTYGTDTDEVTVRGAVDPVAGVRKETVPTDLANLTDATSRATLHVARYGRTAPVLEGLTLDSRLPTARAAAEALLIGPPTARLEVRDLPAPAPSPWVGYLEGWALTVWADRWRLALDASPALWSGALLPWSGANVSTWADLDRTQRWQDASTALEWR
jgi:hypothetical protein